VSSREALNEALWAAAFLTLPLDLVLVRGSVSVNRVMLVMATVVGLAILVRSRPRFPERHLWLVFAAGYAAWATMSAIWSDRAATTLEGAAVLAFYLGTAAVFVATVTRRAAVLTMVAAWTAGTSILAVLVIINKVRGITYVTAATEFSPATITDDRISAGRADPNQVAVLLALGLIALLWFALHDRPPRPGQLLVPALIGGLAVVHATALYLTASRSGLPAAVVGAIPVVLSAVWADRRSGRRTRPIIILITGAALTVALVVAVPDVAARFAVGDVTSDFPLRGDAWSAGMDMFADRPATGVGYRLFPNEMFDATGIFRGSHSMYVGTMAELGLPGVALLAGTFVAVVLTVRTYRRPETRALAYGWICALLAAGVLLDIHTKKSFFFILALVIALDATDGAEVSARSAAAHRRAGRT
jgi:O-antigen ligase